MIQCPSKHKRSCYTENEEMIAFIRSMKSAVITVSEFDRDDPCTALGFLQLACAIHKQDCSFTSLLMACIQLYLIKEADASDIWKLV